MRPRGSWWRVAYINTFKINIFKIFSSFHSGTSVNTLDALMAAVWMFGVGLMRALRGYIRGHSEGIYSVHLWKSRRYPLMLITHRDLHMWAAQLHGGEIVAQVSGDDPSTVVAASPFTCPLGHGSNIHLSSKNAQAPPDVVVPSVDTTDLAPLSAGADTYSTDPAIPMDDAVRRTCTLCMHGSSCSVTRCCCSISSKLHLT